MCTNATIYKQTDLSEIAKLYELLDSLGVDGYMITPAYSYAAVQSKEIFMSRDEIRDAGTYLKLFTFMSRDEIRWKFRKAAALLGRFNPRLSARRSRDDVHGLGQSDIQPSRLEGSLLSDD